METSDPRSGRNWDDRRRQAINDLDNPSLFDEANLSLRGNFFLFASTAIRYRGKEYRCNVGVKIKHKLENNAPSSSYSNRVLRELYACVPSRKTRPVFSSCNRILEVKLCNVLCGRTCCYDNRRYYRFFDYQGRRGIKGGKILRIDTHGK